MLFNDTIRIKLIRIIMAFYKNAVFIKEFEVFFENKCLELKYKSYLTTSPNRAYSVFAVK